MAGMSVEGTFLLGAIGAAAPEILRLYELRVRPEDFKWSWSYLLMTAPFLFLGGLVAVILPATTVWGAFYTGVSLPVTISTIAKKALDLPQMGGTLSTTSTSAGSEARGATARVGAQVPLEGVRAYISALF